MSWRKILLHKKRGSRSTGVRSVGHWSELFLSISLVVVGAITLALHVFQVMIPDWRESRALRGFEAGVCEITEQLIHERDNPLNVGEFAIEIKASRVTDEGLLPPVWIQRQLGNFSPTRIDVEQMAKLFAPGTRHACWYDPTNPERLVLRRTLRWWPWPVMLIPASLLGVGVWGIVASLMQVATSAERRSLVAIKAVRLDSLRDSPNDSASTPTLPQDDPSIGTHYPHRLAAAGSAGWRMAGLMLVCGIWNTLLAYFVYVASVQYLHGNPPWLALGLVLVLGLVGVWLAFSLIAEFWERRGIGPTLLEVSEHPLTVGGKYSAYFIQYGRMELQSLIIELVCEESATYQQGTDSRTSLEVVHRQELRKWRRIMVEATQPLEADFTFEIGDHAMHSFRSPHNEIRWMLVVRGETSRRQPVLRQYALQVRPLQVVDDSDLVASTFPRSEEAPA